MNELEELLKCARATSLRVSGVRLEQSMFYWPFFDPYETDLCQELC